MGHCAALVVDSPFLPHGYSGTQLLEKRADALELRGAMAGPSGRQYYIYDPTKKRGVWLGNDDKDNPITIISEDVDKGSVEIKLSDGRLVNLEMHEVKTAPTGVVTPSTAVSLATSGENAGLPKKLVTETQAAWNEEFQRRLAENAARN